MIWKQLEQVAGSQCFCFFFSSGAVLEWHISALPWRAEERVSSESYYVPLQPPPPFCFNFLNTWTNKRLALIMGNPLAEQQWIHSGAPSVCVYYAMHIVPVLLDWVFSVPELHSPGKRYRSTPHAVCVKARPWKHTHAHRSGRESASEHERQKSCFSRVISGSVNTHTHTQGCLLSEAFPRCCGTKLHTRMGGWREGGMDGSTEGWRVSLQQLRLTAGINTSLSGGLYLG